MGDEGSNTLARLHAERARLSAELADLRLVRQTVLETVLTGWWWWDTGSESGFISPALTRRLGYPVEEVTTRTVEMLHPPGWLARIREAWQAHVSSGGAKPFDITLPYLRAEGGVLWIRTLGRVVERDAHRMRILGGYVDVSGPLEEAMDAQTRLEAQAVALRQVNSELKTRAEQLAASNAALEDFAFAASHDLQVPLRAVANFAAWIRDELPEESAPEVHTHLSRLLDRVDRLWGLHRDLLLYARAGQAPATTRDIELRTLVSRAWSEKPRGTVRLEALGLPLRILRLSADPLVAALGALFDNAVQHHDRDDGVVQVRGLVVDDRLIMEVEDDGPGVEPRFAEQVFGVLETLRPRDQGAGAGMGLPIARKRAEAAGGTLTLLPRSGRGALFRLEWPVEQPQ